MGEEAIPTDYSKCYGIDCGKCQNPCELQGCGLNVIQEKRETLALANGSSPTLPFNDAIEVLSSDNPEAIISFCRKTLQADIPDDEYIPREVFEKCLAEIVSRIVYYGGNHPKVFTALCKHIYFDYNQSDMARERGVTRAAISKELREGVTNMITRELGMRTPVAKRDKLLGLSPREFEVYKLVFVDGCSERSAAKKLGMSNSMIHRMKQFLREKLSKNGAGKKSVKENLQDLHKK